MRERSWILVLLALATAAGIAGTRHVLGDYTQVPSDDNAAPMIAALARGDLEAAAAVTPAMGLTSIVVRVPFVAVAGHDEMLAFRLGSFACLLALVALLAVLDVRMRRDDRAPLYRFALAATILAGPATTAPLFAGHAEEVLGGVLCVGAVLAAQDRRAVLAGVLLGLAIGTKQWAIIAAPAVLVPVSPGGWFDRSRLLAVGATIVAAAVTLGPVIAMNLDRYRQSTQNLTSTKRTYPQSLWWPIAPSHVRLVDLGGGDQQAIVTNLLPGPLHRGTTTGLALLIAIGVGIVGMRRRGFRDPLAVLAALLVLRCALDPMNLDYYAAPTLLAFAAWDASARAPRGQLPVATLTASILVAGIWRLPHSTTRAVLFGAWLLTLLPLALLFRRDGANSHGDAAGPSAAAA